MSSSSTLYFRAAGVSLLKDFTNKYPAGAVTSFVGLQGKMPSNTNSEGTNKMNNNTYKSQSNPASGLFHLTINSGQFVTHDESFIWPKTYEILKPMLRRRCGIIPGQPQFSVAWNSRLDTHTIAIAKCGIPVILCGLATGPHGATELWDSLLRFNFPLLATGTGIPTQPATTPWLAAGLLPTAFRLNPCEAGLLGCFEACLGLAIMRYNAELN